MYDGEFVLKVAKNNIWYYYFGSQSGYKGEGLPEVEVTEYTCKVPRKTAMCFKELFYAAVFSSSYIAQGNILDGVNYELFYEIGFYTARFDSPRKDTNCYKLQVILDKLHLAVKEDNPSAIEALLPLVTDLTAGFKALFPEDV